MRRSFFFAFSALVLVCAACGARSPLDFDVIEVVESPDGAVISPGQVIDSGSPGDDSGTGSSSGGSSSGGSSSGGILGGEDGGIIACGACVTTQCASSIEACLADTTCATSLECILTTCLAGGGTGGSSSSSGGGGLSCIETCGGGLSGLTDLLPILECIAGTCGSDCGSLLGGLGGLGGLP